MNEPVRIMIPFEEDYLAQFNRIELSDVPAEVLGLYFRLDEGCLPPPEGDPLFVANSRNGFMMALKSGHEPKLLILKNHNGYLGLMETVRESCPDLPVCLIDADQLAALEGDSAGPVYSFTRFSVSAVFRKKPARSLPDVLQSAEKVVVFRGYAPEREELRELGPQVRSAAALFADAVIFQADTVDPYDRTFIRATTGNHFLIPFSVYGSDAELFRILRDQGFTTVLISSMKDGRAVPLEEADCGGRKIALIVDGGILKGQDADPALSCDMNVYVPGSGVPEVAPCLTTITLYKLFSDHQSTF